MWYQILDQQFKFRSEKPALVWLESKDGPSQSVTYRDLQEAVKFAGDHLYDAGIRPGDRVAVLLPKSLPFIFYHLAALRLGAISLPLNTAATTDELVYAVNDSAAAAVVVDHADNHPLNLLRETNIVPLTQPRPVVFRSLTSWPSQLDGDQTAIMIYTSGTTGRPKGAEITHANLTAQLDALVSAWGWSAADRLLHALPLFHVHGLIVALHAALHAGATTILMPRFVAEEVLHALDTHEATIFMGVPTMYYRFVHLEKSELPDLSSVRLFTCGSDRLPDEIFRAFKTRYGHPILERYGMTETGMLLSNPLHGERRPGSVGWPLPGVEARIVDPASGQPLPDGQIGEIQVRGPNVFKGYWQQPDITKAAFTNDGWFRTGDLGLREPDGYFTLKGRAKDLIISGGYNVYPPEVERVLLSHPAVSGCAVIGCPNQEWGERVVAIVTLHDPQNNPDDIRAMLTAYCREHLAAYKVPRSIQITADFPRNSMGKIVKHQLLSHYCREPGKMTLY